ncbi:MAG: carboxymuconolactone decarboxylase family protein [Burkholderiales bacterium]
MRLPPARIPLYLRPLAWKQKRQHGRVSEPTLLWAWRPRAMTAFLRMFGVLRAKRSPLSPRLQAMVSLRVSERTGCGFCIDLNASRLAAAGGDAAAIAQTLHDGSRAAFPERERVALAYAEAMTATPPAVDDALFERVRAQFTPEEVVELTAVIAFQNMSARFNAALGAQPMGYCVLPSADAPRRRA